MTDLNIDLSEYSPVQSAGFVNVPLPSAHLVMITNAELKQSEKDGYVKGINIVIEQEILASSCGNEHVGGTLTRYIPFNDFDEKALSIGRRTLSTLATTIGAIDHSNGRAMLRSLNDLINQPYIIVLDKSKDSNFPQYRKLLTTQGQEVADTAGNFKPCELKEPALATELEKLLALMNNAPQQPQQTQNQQGFGFGNTAPQQPAPTQQPSAPNFMPQNQFGGQPQQLQNQQQVPQSQQGEQNFGFGNAPQQPQQTQNQQGFGQQNSQSFGANTAPSQPNFGGQPQQPQWAQAVNQQNSGQ